MKDNKAFVITVCAIAATICTVIISNMVFKLKLTKMGIDAGYDVNFTK